jgi:hypothetical protein
MIDKKDIIQYREIVPEVTNLPDFDAALNAINRIQ